MGTLNNIVNANDENFATKLAEGAGLVLVDFWAEWCGPCRQLMPVLERFAEAYKEKVTIIKVNVDESPEVSAKMNIRSIPTLILYKVENKEPKKIGERAGSMPYDAIVSWIETTSAV